MKLEFFFEQVWLKLSNIKFHKICLVVAEWLHVDRQAEMMQLTVAFVVVVQKCLICKSVTSHPFSVTAEAPHVHVLHMQLLNSRVAMDIPCIRNCIWRDKSSRLLFNKIVKNHDRQHAESLVFSLFVSHYYWSFHMWCITMGKGCCKCHVSLFACRYWRLSKNVLLHWIIGAT